MRLNEFAPVLAAGAGALARGGAAVGKVAGQALSKVPGAVKTAGQAIGRVPGAVEKVAIQGLELLNDKVPGGIFNPDGSLKGSQYLTKYLSPQEIQQVQQQQQQDMTEGGEGSGRRTADAWDTSPGRVGRVEKTTQGIRHHADPSRYGGSETEPELDRLEKGKVNAMDKALGVKWDRESKRYYSPIKVDETKPKEKEADYGDDYQDMVARVKKLAGMGPLKTVYDPQKRVYKNVPVAVQPAQQPKKERQ
jgi:hypothetical protein